MQDLKKSHLSTSIFKAYLLYLEERLPNFSFSSICEEIGIEAEYLEDEDNWVSISFEKRFMQAINKRIQLKDIPLNCIGLFAVKNKVLGSLEHHIMQAFQKQSDLYNYLPFLTSRINRIIEVDINYYRSNVICYTLKPKLDSLNRVESRSLLSRIPLYAQIISGYYLALFSLKSSSLLKTAPLGKKNSFQNKFHFLRNLSSYRTSVEASKEDRNCYTIYIYCPLSKKVLNLFKTILTSSVLSFILFALFFLRDDFEWASQGSLIFFLTAAYFYRYCISTAKHKEFRLFENNFTKIDNVTTANKVLKQKDSSNRSIMNFIHLISSLDTESEVYKATCQYLLDTMNFNRSFIFLVNSDQSELNYEMGCNVGTHLEMELKALKIKMAFHNTQDHHPLLEINYYTQTFNELLTKKFLETQIMSNFITLPITENQFFYGILTVNPYYQTKQVTFEDMKHLTTVINHMAKAIERIRGRKQLKTAVESYSKFIPSELLSVLGYKDISQVKLDHRKVLDLTVLFNDIRNFTNWCEKSPSPEVTTSLTSYYTYIIPVIEKHNGIVNKFIGDSTMSIFLDPLDAVRASIDIQRANYYFQQLPIQTTIGLCYGKTTVGVIGSENKMEMTVISDTVNVASRLQGLCKDLKANILTAYIPSEVIFSVDKNITLVDHHNQHLKGRKEPVHVLEVVSHNHPFQKKALKK